MKWEPLIWIALGGLVVWGYGQATSTQKASVERSSITSEQRAQQARAVVKAGPTTSVAKTPEGDLIEIEIPSLHRGMFLQVKRCAVWRDAAAKSVAMVCEPEPDLRLPDASPPK